MLQIKPKLKTFDDFLVFADGKEDENRYELTNGELVAMQPESDENVVIAKAMDRALSEIVGYRLVRSHQLAIEMPGQPKNRFPDITVLRPEHLEQLKVSGQSAIRLEMAPPMLVVEVVSPGTNNIKRDYIDKRNQYEWREIPEYWIVDPTQKKVTVLFLTEAGYEEIVFVGDEVVKSPTFEEWALTAAEMLTV
jgi:Uma2 family endonuclease